MTPNEQRDGSEERCRQSFSTLPEVTFPQAVVLVRRAALQLDRYHARFGVHGGLHPAAFMVSGDDGVTIRPPRPATCNPADWHRYASPQRRAGERARPSDDLYSLGMIARQLLARAERTPDRPAHGDNHLRERVDAVLAALTSWSPAERPANGTEVAVALDRLAVDAVRQPAGAADTGAARRQPPEPAWAAAHRVATARRAHRLAQITPPRPTRPPRSRQIRAPLGKGHYPDMPLSTGWVAALILLLCSVYLLPLYFMLFPAG